MDLRDRERGQPCGQRFPFHLGRTAVSLQHATCNIKRNMQQEMCNMQPLKSNWKRHTQQPPSRI
jgi:hypothetical protein